MIGIINLVDMYFMNIRYSFCQGLLSSFFGGIRQLRLLHQQGMMIIKLPIAGELNPTFNSLESHLLTADKNINGYNIPGAISELNLANDQLYTQQLVVLNVLYSFFNNTRAHLKQSIDDLNSGDTQGAFSELSCADSPTSENLQYLSDIIVTADHSLIRFHGRNFKGHYWYNYLYSEQELTPWVEWSVNSRYLHLPIPCIF